jgi:hypothetical protein
MKTIVHSWRNGGDNSKKPTVSITTTPIPSAVIVSDGDTDADGSQRVGTIDPDSGQSDTSLRRSNGWKGEHTYVDSEVVPFFVLPLNWSQVTGISASLGDMAKLTYGDFSVYAIFADQGPRDLIGEASICAIEALGGNPWNSNGTRIVRGIPYGVSYEVRPGTTDLERTVDFKSIQDYGAEIWGEPSKPAKIPSISSWKDLKRGDKGAAVELLQKELNEHFDAQLDVDGDFGSKTETAVRKVESILGSSVNGIVDADVWKTISTLKGLKQDITLNDDNDTNQTVNIKDRDTIPFAIQCPTIRTRWIYQDGWCQGAILHFTAGKDDPKGMIEYLGTAGYPCIVMGRDGKVYQAFKASRGGSHCGTFHHDYSMGLEVIAAGRCMPVTINGVKKYAPWFAYKNGKPETGVIQYPTECFDEAEMRYVDCNGSRQEGWYQKYTLQQEESIIRLFLWYKWMDPTHRFSIEKILGHDEACDQGGRSGAKNDPGGALSMTMPEFRELLTKRWNELMQQTPEKQAAYFGYT